MKLVSIVLPVYNGEKMIAQVIESVVAQTYQHWELIIVDDCSTDTTQKSIEHYCTEDSRIRYVRQDKNEGIQKSLNHGISYAEGEYIARIDADDLWSYTKKLEAQVQFLDTHPAYVLVGTGAVIVDQYGNEISRYLLSSEDSDIRKRMLGKNCFVHASVLIRKAALDKVGVYDEAITTRHVEDHQLWLRLGTVGMLANLPTYSVSLAASPDGITSQHRLIQAYRMVVLAVRFRTKYPRFLVGICVAVVRLCFFAVVTVLPFPKKILYRIQSKTREV